MDKAKRLTTVDSLYASPQHEERPTTPKQAALHCDICGSEDVRLVSGGKYRCLTCGYLPS